MSDDKISCLLCGAKTHAVQKHLKDAHPETSIEEYRARFPNQPVLSEWAEKKVREVQKQKASQAADADGHVIRPFHEVFDIPKNAEGALNKRGEPIPIKTVAVPPPGYEEFVPKRDPNYFFPVEELKMVIMGLTIGFPTYLYGHAGTGKSTLIEQACAGTGRACMRVQHTVNTEESHVTGQYVVKAGETVWEPGPLQICMKHGLVYMADEYDRGIPQVLSVYQPVLEGKALITKEAPPEWRKVDPHPMFRFMATGNTNGSGDETGLYPSTALQDFANYERFVVMQLGWMPAALEISVVSAQGGVIAKDAEKLVKYAADIRKQVDAGQMAAPISPRALIRAAMIGSLKRSYKAGLQLAYINRLPQTDAEAARQLAQRYFAEKE